MDLVDDLKDPGPLSELERRRFLRLLAAGALGIAAAGSAAATWIFLEPRVVYEEDKRVAVGRPEDITAGTVLVLTRQQVYVVRTEQGFIALSSRCTHLGCITRRAPDQDGFVCPCHGSRFHGDGTVRQGPAANPLRRLAVSIDRGLLVVDAGTIVAPDAVFEVPA